MENMRKALIVGINDYPGAQLRGCVNDANAMASVLGTDGNGDPNFEVKLLTSPSKISKAMLRGAIEWLFQGEWDLCLFYFSGHGTVTSTGGYIVTPDAERYDEGVSMDDIVKLANRSDPKKAKVILLDCCHSGALGTPPLAESGMASLSEGLSILTASSKSESALEVDGRGIFTSLVVDALRGQAADLLGNITPGSIYAYVDRALGAWDQRPMFKTNVTRFTSLRSVTPPLSRETLRKLCTYFLTPQGNYSLDPSYEFTDPRQRPANVAIMKDLQKLASVGLVVPVGEEHMYFAAINSKSCRLTALGHQYWRLVKQKKI
jgi:hypothetical protein